MKIILQPENFKETAANCLSDLKNGIITEISSQIVLYYVLDQLTDLELKNLEIIRGGDKYDTGERIIYNGLEAKDCLDNFGYNLMPEKKYGE